MGKPYEKGLVLFRQRRYRQAIEQFQAELSGQPNSCVAHSMLALAFLNDKQIDAAYAEVTEAIRINPQYAFAFYAMSHVQLQMPTRKQRHFRLVISNSPQEELRRRYKLALKSIAQAIALAPMNPDFLAHQASLLGAVRRWPAALAAAERGLQANPNHIDCANQRAVALRHLGNVEEAESETTRSLAINPEHPATHRTRGWLMLQNGKPDQAKRHFAEALRIDPLNRNAKSGLFHARIANRVPMYGWLVQFLLWAYTSRIRPFFIVLLVCTGAGFGFLKDQIGEPQALLITVGGGLSLMMLMAVVIRLTTRRRPKAPAARTPNIAQEDVRVS